VRRDQVRDALDGVVRERRQEGFHLADESTRCECPEVMLGSYTTASL
jgi:hypothetical protein